MTELLAVTLVVQACAIAGESNPPLGPSESALAASPPAMASQPPTAAATQRTSPGPEPTSGAWVHAAPMPFARSGFDAVVLGDGTVLVVGDDRDCAPGGAQPGSEMAQVYVPAENAWHDVEALDKPRKDAAMVNLADGSAMVIGGVNSDEVGFSSTKVYSPEAGHWRDGPLLNFARERPIATTLTDGRVLLLGEVLEAVDNAPVELFDPGTNRWVLLPPVRPHWTPLRVVALPGARALVTGTDWSGAEPRPMAFVYDSDQDRWRNVQPPSAPYGPELVVLDDGTIVALGGLDGGELWGGDGGTIDLVERFDPEAGTWSATGSMSMSRIDGQAVGLDGGRLLVAGGQTFATFEASEKTDSITPAAEAYDSAAERWLPVPELRTPRWGGHALALHDGSVLVLGGYSAHAAPGEVPACAHPETTVERLAAH